MNRVLSAIPLLVTASLTAQSEIHRFWGDDDVDVFGAAAAIADVNADGYADVIVGAQSSDHGGFDLGMVRVFSGQDGSVLYSVYGEEALCRFGHAVASAGDVNGDGFDDVIVGSYDCDVAGSNYGAAYVLSGVDGTPIHTVYGTFTNAYFGRTVSGAGDVNADGFDDFIVGHAGSSWVRLFSGLDASPMHALLGLASPATVAGVGDVNGDGYDDVVRGASRQNTPNGNETGLIRVTSGRDGATLYDFYGDADHDRLGHVVSRVGDVNGDGFDDVLATSLGRYARIWSGFDGTELYTISSSDPADYFGQAATGVGDIDFDGYHDFVITSEREDFDVFREGCARLYSGYDGSVLHVYEGEVANQYFGSSCGGFGDVNGDGRPDFVVGTHYADGYHDNQGLVRVLTLDDAFTPSFEQIHGAGCPGSNGWVPRIEYTGSAHVGTTFGVSMRGGLPGANASLSIGNATATPLDAIGMVGCTLYVNSFVTVSTPLDSFGMGGVSISIADDPGMIGSGFEFQWTVADAAAPYDLPLSFSDALSIVVGG